MENEKDGQTKPSTQMLQQPPIDPQNNSWPKAIYLMYGHFCEPFSTDSNSLYKLDLPLPNSLPITDIHTLASPKDNSPTTRKHGFFRRFFCHCWWQKSVANHFLHASENKVPSLSPVLLFPAKDRFTIKIKCTRLGSKVYFLGGQVESSDTTPEDIFPRNVFVYDLNDATPSLKKMESKMNVGKPNPCMFTYNGKIYVLGSGPTTTMEFDGRDDCRDYFSFAGGPMFGKTFECYDPKTDEWDVIEEEPTQIPTYWEGCFVLERHGLAVFFGNSSVEKNVTFLFDINRRKWQMPLGQESQDRRAKSSLYHLFNSPCCEAGSEADEYVLYGIHSIYKIPIKMSLKVSHESDGEDINIIHENVSTVSIFHNVDNPFTRKYIVQAAFNQPYFISRFQLLSLGDGYLCYVVAGNLYQSETGPNRYGIPVLDPGTWGVKVAVFKEIDHDGIGGEEETSTKSSSFQVEILYSQYHVTKTDDSPAIAHLTTSFVVSQAELQKMKETIGEMQD